MDGNIDKAKTNLIFNFAVKELGFIERVFADLVKNITNVEDIYPTSEDDISTYLFHLVQLTYSVGYVYDNEIAYIETYFLPYLKSIVEKDFGINIHDNTHVKLLLKRK